MKRLISFLMVIMVVLSMVAVSNAEEAQKCTNFVERTDDVCCYEELGPCPEMTKYFIITGKRRADAYVCLRKKTSEKATVVDKLYSRDPVTVLEFCEGDDEGWAYIRHDGRKGYVKTTQLFKKEFVCCSYAKVKEMTDEYLVNSWDVPVLSSACGNANQIWTLQRGDRIRLCGIDESGWARIIFRKNNLGYVDSNYIYKPEDE